MDFRLAKECEKNIILNIYNEVRYGEYSSWDEEYPTMFDIDRDLMNNNLFVLELDGEIIGCVSLNTERELDSYFDCIEDNFCEFGRVVIRKDKQGNGYSKILISNLEKEIKNRGFTSIRIGVYVNNPPAIKLYTNLGYIEQTEVFIFGNTYKLMSKNI